MPVSTHVLYVLFSHTRQALGEKRRLAAGAGMACMLKCGGHSRQEVTVLDRKETSMSREAVAATSDTVADNLV